MVLKTSLLYDPLVKKEQGNEKAKFFYTLRIIGYIHEKFSKRLLFEEAPT